MAGSNGTMEVESKPLVTAPAGEEDRAVKVHNNAPEASGGIIKAVDQQPTAPASVSEKELQIRSQATESEDPFIARVYALAGALIALTLIGTVAYLSVVGREVSPTVMLLAGVAIGVPLNGPGVSLNVGGLVKTIARRRTLAP